MVDERIRLKGGNGLQMLDYIKRFLIAIIMALCVSLLFLGVRTTEAESLQTMNAKEHWIWPADGVISDTFGTRNGKHKGIDIAGKWGTPILSVEEGEVIKSYYSNTYGNVVFIKHPSNFVTVYAHLSSRAVTTGEKVKQGDVIGHMGKTGHSTGTHLHFESHQQEWRYDKKFAIDPEILLGKADVGEAVKGGVAGIGKEVLEVSSQIHQQVTQPSQQLALSNKKLYQVKKGDTLYSIAKSIHMPVSDLKEINGLTSDVIQPNQILIIK
jgi:murein DD-endopeptidase MepM/ murein hydrolase activator NlpD